MHGFLEMMALLVFVVTVTGLILTGVVSATLAIERRAADRRSADRRAAGSATTSGNARVGGPAGARAPGLSTEGRDERRPEQAART
jgi:hypothetical protein